MPFLLTSSHRFDRKTGFQLRLMVREKQGTCSDSGNPPGETTSTQQSRWTLCPFCWYNKTFTVLILVKPVCVDTMSYLLWANCFGLVVLNKSNKCLMCCLIEAEACALYTDFLTTKQSTRMRVWAIHRNISGQPLFPEKQLLFGYVGNEMGEGEWAGCTHLRKWPCTLMSRPQPVTCRNSVVCIFNSWGLTRSPCVCLCWVRSSLIITCLRSENERGNCVVLNYSVTSLTFFFHLVCC